MKCTKHITVIIIIHDYCTFNITVRKQVQIRAAVCFGHKFMAKVESVLSVKLALGPQSVKFHQFDQ